MTLDNYKIPIYIGINDSPTSEGDAKHPNGAFVTDKYNSLIDKIKEFDSTTIKTSPIEPFVEIYLDSTQGDDNNIGDANNPIQTITKAIELFNQHNSLKYDLWVTGNLELNIIDITKLTSSSPYDFFIHQATFTVNNTLTPLWLKNDYASLVFYNCTFEVNAEILLQKTTNVRFADCTFNCGNVFKVIEFLDARNITIDSCSFNINTGANIQFFIDAFDSTLRLDYPFFGQTDSNVFRFTNSFVSVSCGDQNIILDFNNSVGTILDLYDLSNAIIYNYNSIISHDNFLLINNGINKDTTTTVLDSQQSDIADATTGTEIATINSILSALRGYGVLGT